MKKNFCFFLFIFSIILLNILIFIHCIALQENQENYFRLHIVANSNSIDDQIVKLNVTKKINTYISSLLDTCKSKTKENSKQVISKNLNNIIEVANNEITANNKDYSSYINFGKIYYDEKTSSVINMDKGVYDSIQIVLGEGSGQNFWSLIFPYSYNLELTEIQDVTTDNSMQANEIKIKSGLLEDIKKVVKLFS